jgi:[ribosomal protein S18]-alanine N-acetyltransferase
VCAEVGKSAGFLIRAFREEDATAASEILRHAPEAAGWSAELTRATFSSGRVSGFVSDKDGRPAGFILGREILDEGEILNLAVERENRGRGAGTALVKKMLSAFAARGVSRVFLEVRESNLGAIAFYQKLGFRQVGRREGYYREPLEAALVFEGSTKNSQLGTD